MTGVILLFGKLRDAFGASEIPVPPGAATVADLRALLIARNPDIAATLSPAAMRIALNQELVADETAAAIAPGDEIALLPPLSGG